MKPIRLSLLLLFGTILALGATGCNSLFGGGDPVDEVDAGYYDESYYSDLNYSLDEPNGGYDVEDEEPYFGDPDFAAMMDEEEDAADDAVGDDPGVADMEEDPVSQVYYLRLLWGQLDWNPELEEITTWSGTISVDRGAIVVLRRIKFEHVTDWVVFPRENPQVVDLYSLTRPHFDGLLLKIIDDDPDADTENNLVIDMGPGQITLPVAELDGYAEIYDVDDLGNQMSLRSPEILDCPNGFLAGIWVQRHGHPRGIYRGVFTSYEGGVRGCVRGHWGINEAGERVFRGKYIGLGGEFRGLMNGTWLPDPDGMGGYGSFEGRWVSASGEVEGILGGHYRRGFRRGGFFSGRWVEECGL